MKFGKASRTISVLFALILIISLIAGCSQTTDSTTTTTTTNTTTRTTTQGQTTTQTETEAETTDEIDPFGKYEPKIVIKVAKEIGANMSFDTSDPNKESLEKNVWTKAYEDNLGITFDYVLATATDQYVTKWNLAIASRNVPDMGFIPYQVFTQLAEADMLEEMSYYFDAYASPMYKQVNQEDGEIAYNYNMYEGKVLGLPMTGNQYDNMPLLCVRQDWLDNLGLKVPKTMDEFYQVAKAFKEQDPNNSGSDDTLGWFISYVDLPGFLNGYYAYYETWTLNSAGEIVWGSIQPEAKEALAMLQKMYAEGLIPEDFAVLDPATASQDVSKGKVGLFYGNFATPLTNIRENTLSDENAYWTIAPIPTVDGKLSKAQAYSQPFGAFVVRKGYEYPEAAVKLANLDLQLLFDDPQNYSAIGGFNYQLYRISGINFPWRNLKAYRGIREAYRTGDSSHLDPRDSGIFANIKLAQKGDRTHYGMMQIFDQGNSTFQVIDYLLENDGYHLSPYQSISTERMNEIFPTLTDLVSETYYKIIMGDSLDTFDQMVQNWLNMGGEEITKEANEWLSFQP